jgi:hypothetical protein
MKIAQRCLLHFTFWCLEVQHIAAWGQTSHDEKQHTLRIQHPSGHNDPGSSIIIIINLSWYWVNGPGEPNIYIHIIGVRLGSSLGWFAAFSLSLSWVLMSHDNGRTTRLGELAVQGKGNRLLVWLYG